MLLVVVAVPRYQVEQDYENGFLEKEGIPAQVNEYRQTLIQLLGGVVVLIALYLTWRRILATEETVVVSQEGQTRLNAPPRRGAHCAATCSAVTPS